MTGPRPDPPADLDRRDLPYRDQERTPPLAYRIHRATRDPLFFGPPTPAPESRFDDPEGRYKVCYLGLQREAALVETLLRNPQWRTLSWNDDIAVRNLAEIRIVRPLRLVEMDGAGLRTLGATIEVLGTRDYTLPNHWSRALWSHPDRPDGICYGCRHDNQTFAVALFDRARDAVAVRRSGPLTGEARWLGEMSRRYRFGLTP
jgi:hypothetical protein